MSRWKQVTGLVLVAAAASAAQAWNRPPQGGGMPGMPGPGMRPPMPGGPGGGMMQPPPGGSTQRPGPAQPPGPGDAVGALMRTADADDSHDISAEEWAAFLDGLAVLEGEDAATGAVDLDDLAAKLPEPPMGWPEDSALRDEHFVRAFDADRDGVVTKTDLQTIYERFTAGAADRPDAPPPPDGDGARPPRHRGRACVPVGALLRAADADDSHDVSAEEWTTFLDGLVVDGNGAISLDDLASKLPEPPQGWPEDTAVRDEHLVRAFDVDRDGAVTKADLEAIFGRVDRNDDGAAAPEEHRAPPRVRGREMRGAKLLARAADGDDSRDVTAEEWAAFLAGLGADEATGAVPLDALAAALPAPRNGWPTDTEKRDEMLLRAFDADRDGTVTTADLQALFDALDRNQDGALDASDRPRRR